MSIDVDYRIPAGVDAERHATIIAVGQTAGSWSDHFAHREEGLRAHLGQVSDLSPLDDGATKVTIRFPEGNVEGDIGTLLTMIFGKVSMAGPAKVIDIRLPGDYGTRPQLGITGIRERLGVHDRPLIMAIFKPALGLTAADHAKILSEVADAGLDIIKDDEILGDLEGAPTLERMRACREVIDARDRPLLYAVNVTGRADQLLDRAKRLADSGANALLLNVLSHGFSVLETLATDPTIDLPIFAHPALAGAWCAAPEHGLSYSAVLGTLMSHAGADAVLYPAHYGSMPFDIAQEHGIRDALRARNVFAVPSAGIHPGVVPKAMADYGNDVILNAGTGIMDHPDGPGAGVRAFFEALDRHASGGSFNRDEVGDGPLRRALDKWSR